MASGSGVRLAGSGQRCVKVYLIIFIVDLPLRLVYGVDCTLEPLLSMLELLSLALSTLYLPFHTRKVKCRQSCLRARSNLSLASPTLFLLL